MLTGWSKRTRRGDPGASVSQRSLSRAIGVRTLRRSRRCEPSAQASQPGRRTTTSTETRSPGRSFCCGVNRPARTRSGILRPAGSKAAALPSVPPSGCTTTRASAAGSPASVAPDQNTTARTTPASGTARTANEARTAETLTCRAYAASSEGQQAAAAPSGTKSPPAVQRWDGCRVLGSHERPVRPTTRATSASSGCGAGGRGCR